MTSGVIRLLYLSSLESDRFAPVRQCQIIEYLTFDTGKAAAIATVRPGVPAQDLGLSEDIGTVILTARHAGTSVDELEAFPFFVFITIPQAARSRLKSPIRQDDLRIIGWGELYRSPDDARIHH